MPVYDTETHEALLNELNNPELDHARRIEILQDMRLKNAEVLNEQTEANKYRQESTNTIQDLTIANSKLFRKLGITEDEGMKKKEEEKSFSETVTLESLEKKY